MKDAKVETLTTSRGPVEYLDSGRGEVTLSLHGALGGYDQSQILARTIGESGFRYLSLSRPGYLGTPLSAGRTPEEQADLYAEVVELLGVRQVVVFAVSGGGPSAIHFALRHGEKCRGLVLVSTVGGRADFKVPLTFKAMTLLARWPALACLMQRKAEQNLARNLRRSVADPTIFERMVNDPEVMGLYKELAVGCFYRMGERIKGTVNDKDISRTRTYPLQEVAVPVLVIHGSRDPLLPIEQHGRRLAAEIPGAELLVAEGGGHGAIFTHRKEIRQTVAAFLQRLNSKEINRERTVE